MLDTVCGRRSKVEVVTRERGKHSNELMHLYVCSLVDIVLSCGHSLCKLIVLYLGRKADAAECERAGLFAAVFPSDEVYSNTTMDRSLAFPFSAVCHNSLGELAAIPLLVRLLSPSLSDMHTRMDYYCYS